MVVGDPGILAFLVVQPFELGASGVCKKYLYIYIYVYIYVYIYIYKLYMCIYTQQKTCELEGQPLAMMSTELSRAIQVNTSPAHVLVPPSRPLSCTSGPGTEPRKAIVSSRPHGSHKQRRTTMNRVSGTMSAY